MAESEKMSKSERLKHKYLERMGEKIAIIDDFESLYEILDAVAEEALEKRAMQEKVQTKH